MHIYIPSLGRATQQNIAAGPLADMSDVLYLQHAIHYVVPIDEVDAYKSVLPEWVKVLACPMRGIAKTRRWIGVHANESQSQMFMMLDDDIRFLIRKDESVWNLRGTTPSEVSDLLDFVVHLLDGQFGHVGVSAREGNNNMGVGTPEGLYSVNTRTLRALAYRTEDFLRMEHGRVEVMEDFDVNLQLLEAGIPNACIGYWAQGQKMTNAPGGCSTYRSLEVQDASARELQRLHGAHVVRLRQKENKTDAEGFGTRTEVTIMWKKAYSGS